MTTFPPFFATEEILNGVERGPKRISRRTQRKADPFPSSYRPACITSATEKKSAVQETSLFNSRDFGEKREREAPKEYESSWSWTNSHVGMSTEGWNVRGEKTSTYLKRSLFRLSLRSTGLPRKRRKTAYSESQIKMRGGKSPLRINKSLEMSKKG